MSNCCTSEIITAAFYSLTDEASSSDGALKTSATRGRLCALNCGLIIVRRASLCADIVPKRRRRCLHRAGHDAWQSKADTRSRRVGCRRKSNPRCSEPESRVLTRACGAAQHRSNSLRRAPVRRRLSSLRSHSPSQRSVHTPSRDCDREGVQRRRQRRAFRDYRDDGRLNRFRSLFEVGTRTKHRSGGRSGAE